MMAPMPGSWAMRNQPMVHEVPHREQKASLSSVGGTEINQPGNKGVIPASVVAAQSLSRLNLELPLGAGMC